MTPETIFAILWTSYFAINIATAIFAYVSAPELEWTTLGRKFPRGFIIACVVAGCIFAGLFVVIHMTFFQRRPREAPAPQSAAEIHHAAHELGGP